MPVTTDNIPRPEELSQWPYLKNVQLPYIRAEVELLIGTNAPKVMEPWEIVNSQDDCPYAVKTLLGWIVNGPLRGVQTTGNAETSVYVNRISVANLEKLLISKYNQEFSEVTSEEKKELSMEDKTFLYIVNESAVLQDNHYSLKLPFKEEHSMMPNNQHIAEQRLLILKRKFKNSEQYQQEYIKFMNEILERNYAEEVPPKEVKPSEGSTWYIPHHGLYHPKMKTLRVVFDCGATYKGTSLNSERLQGPDLISPLIGVL